MASSSRSVELEMLMPLIEERLAAGQSVRFEPHGISMLPMIRQGIDSVVLSPVTGPLKKYDIPLYRRADGRFVLHRIVRITDTYTCIGDNQFVMEPGINHSQVIAVVTSFYRDGRPIEVTNLGYRIYCRFWHYSRGWRRFWRRGIGWLKRHLH